MSEESFSSLALSTAIFENLSTLDYKVMTPIQVQSLPHILEGKDVIAQAKTGSGKTAAFALGLLEKLDAKLFCVQSLVLCPTRELADQVAKEIRRLARAVQNIKVLTLCGGMSFGTQVSSLEQGVHIIVGTPGRIEDHLQKATLSLDRLNYFVLDEADRMLDMGFQDSLDAIIKHLPKQRQTLLFSATYPEQIKTIAKRIMINPLLVQAPAMHDSSSIQQHFYEINDDKQRITALRLLLLQYCPDSSLIFCNTKVETEELAKELCHYGFSALALNGDMEQKVRDQTLVRFSNKSISVLVATDVAARGLDIDTLGAVINYQIPRDLEVYVHRIGRTGRAGNQGIACTLYSKSEQYKLDKLSQYLNAPIEAAPLPAAALLKNTPYKAPMITLQIAGGKKRKLRPGDILGALTGDQGINGKQVGKINVFDNSAYVAVSRDVAQSALKKLTEGTLKGRSVRVNFL